MFSNIYKCRLIHIDSLQYMWNKANTPVGNKVKNSYLRMKIQIKAIRKFTDIGINWNCLSVEYAYHISVSNNSNVTTKVQDFAPMTDRIKDRQKR